MRKTQLLLSILAVFVLFVSSCTPAPQATTAPEPTKPPEAAAPAATATVGGAIEAKQDTPTPAPTVAASKYKQAPALDADVKAGKLKPVEERLPATPLVTAPVDKVGKYGGTLHTASWWPEVGNVLLFFGVDAPIKWKADLTGYEPALVESYEWSADGKTFTMHMRKGLKWSDGEPYTSADWKFMWEDIMNFPDVKYQTIPAYMRNADGTPITLAYPDDYTVQWIAKDRPLWVDPYFMAQGYWEFSKTLMKPAHYLKQFHPKYTPGKTLKDLEAADKWWLTPNYPCLFAWCNVAVSSDSTRYTFGRNPYFWRVDPDGNQLPYIDNIDVEIVSDEQVRILNCSQGKYDVGFRICGGPNDIPFLEEQSKAGGYHLLKGWTNGAGAWPGYMVNQDYVAGGKNYPDDTPEHAKEIRDLLRNKDFRVALSTGMDRQRMVDVVWNGIADIKNYTISPQSWHFASPEGKKVYDEWAKNAITFDAAGANALLDKIGMKKGSDGFRTLPSGKEFTMTIDVSDWGGSLKVQTDAAAEAKNQWEKNLGIKVEVKNLQGQPDLDTRTNEGYFMLRGAHVSEIDILTYPDWVFPVVNRYYMPLEGRYYAKGGEACKPTSTDQAQVYKDCGMKPEAGSPAEKLQNFYKQAMAEPDMQKRHEIVWKAIREVHIAEGPFIIGVAGDQAMPIFAKDYMRNILDFGVVGPWAPATPGNTVPAQWWIEK